jgi:hypothetical protein
MSSLRRPTHYGELWGAGFILAGLENGRRIENWLKIELDGPDS